MSTLVGFFNMHQSECFFSGNTFIDDLMLCSSQSARQKEHDAHGEKKLLPLIMIIVLACLSANKHANI
jgi:hypothetical protein